MTIIHESAASAHYHSAKLLLKHHSATPAYQVKTVMQYCAETIIQNIHYANPFKYCPLVQYFVCLFISEQF